MATAEDIKHICVRGAREHNLKNVNIDIPKYKLVVITGVSGSGKSSLAFDTIHTEGERRYVESLSAYARQFLDIQDKPDVDYITGLSPSIAIDQKNTRRNNPRSNLSTSTEIYDHLRVLYARIGIPYSPATGQPIKKQSASQIIKTISEIYSGTKINILSPLVIGKKGEHRKEILSMQRQGFERFRIDGSIYTIDEIPILDKNKKHNIEVIIDRLTISEELENRLADSIETALKISNGIVFIEIISTPEEAPHKEGEILIFSEKFSCPVSDFTITEIEPRIFSFNSPYGACPKCDGLGNEVYFDPTMVVPNPSLSLKNGAIAPWSKDNSQYATSQSRMYQQVLENLSRHYNFSLHKPFEELPEEVKEIILYGSKGEEIEFLMNDGFRTTKLRQKFEGVIPTLQQKAKKTESDYVRDELSRYQNNKPCSECHGYRLKFESLCIKILDKHIGQVCEMSVADSYKWFKSLDSLLTPTHLLIAEKALLEIKRRLQFLIDVGLDYLTLNRESGTLSGGESQRIRLASQIGSGLSGVLYVLDEPSIGLHQCDNEKLIVTLKNLRDLGNTVIVVEHDEETIRAADHLIDVGTGAGVYGGEIIAEGSVAEVAAHETSVTGLYLSGKKFIPIPKKRRKPQAGRAITVYGARSHNLRNINVTLPLSTFTAITGVSGSGKSTFTIQTLYRAAVKKLHNAKAIPGEYTKITGLEFIDKVIEIDQSPIGRTPRSNPATYTGAFTPIRDWFSSLSEAKARGYKAGRFSFNVKGGRCETCEGDGVIRIEMHFLPDVYVKCEECHGARYNKETLEIKYKNKSIADVLDMTVEEAEEFFTTIPLIQERLTALREVGLGYMKIGQSATTLSGGEAQRVKLSKELSRRSTGRTLYILDEPTTGLHSDDINRLLKVLHKLVDTHNTVLVIEHNLDVIKTADHVIDIGPYGGTRGGEVVVAGTPEEVAACPNSITGKYLKPYLEKKEFYVDSMSES